MDPARTHTAATRPPAARSGHYIPATTDWSEVMSE
jgi:hypothetical protein